MVETKDLRKGIIQLEWENKMKRMQIEDLKNKARDIQMLRLSEDQKEVSVVITILKHLNICLSHGPRCFVASIKYWLALNEEISSK